MAGDAHRFGTEIASDAREARAMRADEYVTVAYDELHSPSGQALIRRAYANLGFLTVSMPSAFAELVPTIHRTSADFFSLDTEIKTLVSAKSFTQPSYSNIGYFPMETEKAQSATVPDKKEFVHIGRSPTESEGASTLYVDIPWPSEATTFGAAFRAHFTEMAICCRSIFLAMAAAFEVDPSYAAALIEDGNSILRSIHYPPIDEYDEAMRAAPHHGMNLIGVQIRSTHPGLQFYTPNNEWVYIDDWSEDLVTVNIGRMFGYILNGRARPTLHRVVNELEGSSRDHRYTTVMFYHGNPRASLIPLPGSEDLPPVVVGDWTKKRLKDLNIG